MTCVDRGELYLKYSQDNKTLWHSERDKNSESAESATGYADDKIDNIYSIFLQIKLNEQYSNRDLNESPRGGPRNTMYLSC